MKRMKVFYSVTVFAASVLLLSAVNSGEVYLKMLAAAWREASLRHKWRRLLPIITLQLRMVTCQASGVLEVVSVVAIKG